jgi:DNA repair exonuclease SbcCD nuclease subunit
MDRKPFTFLRTDTLEILAIPHQQSYGDYHQWAVPSKQRRLRIGVAHGTVLGMPYTFADDESGGSALEPELFSRFEVDYAALGHIHRTGSYLVGGMHLVYPGSSRVWRKGESGSHGVQQVTCGSEIRTGFLPLKSAGTYRTCETALSLEGETDNLENAARQWRAEDWIDLRITGVVEDENSARGAAREIADSYGRRVRRLDIDRDAVVGLAGIASQPLAKRFLEIWKTREPPGDDRRRIWMRSREMALTAIKTILEVRA